MGMAADGIPPVAGPEFPIIPAGPPVVVVLARAEYLVAGIILCLTFRSGCTRIM
jgi:hypothetical protein